MTYLLLQASANALPLRDESVQCVVTSPPYWGLRSYAGEQGATWGDGSRHPLGLEPTPELYVAHMVEVFREVRRVLRKDGVMFLNLGDSYASSGSGARPYDNAGTAHGGSIGRDSSSRNLCDGCEAALLPRTARTGTQPAPTQAADSHAPNLAHTESATAHPANAGSYRQTLTHRSSDAIQDQRRMLGRVDEQPHVSQESTTLESSLQPPAWCSHCDNCDACLSVLRSSSRDAQACARTAGYRNGSAPHESALRSQGMGVSDLAYPHSTTASLKPKDLVGIPWMVAFALRADGWYLRSDIIWHKPNPMPESVTDRPTKSHEYLFLLAKNERYFYDADAIREDFADERMGASGAAALPYSAGSGRNDTLGGDGRKGLGVAPAVSGRNKRSVWTVATRPYAGAHFATYPEELVEPCILAGSSPQACGECGAPWERVTERTVGVSHDGPKTAAAAAARGGRGRTSTVGQSGGGRVDGSVVTLGWQPTCAHADGSGKSAVLDLFNGSGTTGRVAMRHGRSYVGVDISREYLDEQALARIDPLAAQKRDVARDGLGQAVLL